MTPTTAAGSEHCPQNGDSLPCRTLGEYAENSHLYLDSNINVSMIFLPGVHNLTKELHITTIKFLSLVGCGHYSDCSSSATNQPKTILLSFDLKLDGLSNVNVSDLSFNGGNGKIIVFVSNIVVNMDGVSIIESALQIKPRYYFNRGEAMVILSNMVFNGSTLMLYMERANHIIIRNAVFFLGSAGNAMTFCGIMSDIIIENVTTQNGRNSSIPAWYCHDTEGLDT